jgi:hypothetical protein
MKQSGTWCATRTGGEPAANATDQAGNAWKHANGESAAMRNAARAVAALGEAPPFAEAAGRVENIAA